MSKFKVGDLIIGNERADSEYKLTRKDVICAVEIAFPDGEDMIVRIVKSPFDISDADMNKPYCVGTKYFDKYTGSNHIDNEQSVTSKPNNSEVKKYMEKTIDKPSTIKFDIKEGKRYKSFGKHSGATIETVTTTITLNGKTASATCDKDNYNERQGILEALGNMFYDNFDREYEKYVHQKNMKFRETCKCTICGKLYETPEDARSCENGHEEKRAKKFSDYLLRKEAIRRIKEAEHEKKIEALMAEIYDKRNKDKQTTDRQDKSKTKGKKTVKKTKN
jgi:hypothetical protein